MEAGENGTVGDSWCLLLERLFQKQRQINYRENMMYQSLECRHFKGFPNKQSRHSKVWAASKTKKGLTDQSFWPAIKGECSSQRGRDRFRLGFEAPSCCSPPLFKQIVIAPWLAGRERPQAASTPQSGVRSPTPRTGDLMIMRDFGKSAQTKKNSNWTATAYHTASSISVVDQYWSIILASRYFGQALIANDDHCRVTWWRNEWWQNYVSSRGSWELLSSCLNNNNSWFKSTWLGQKRCVHVKFLPDSFLTLTYYWMVKIGGEKKTKCTATLNQITVLSGFWTYLETFGIPYVHNSTTIYNKGHVGFITF